MADSEVVDRGVVEAAGVRQDGMAAAQLREEFQRILFIRVVIDDDNSRWVVKVGVGVREVRPASGSLEEVFASLTQTDEAPDHNRGEPGGGSAS